MRQCPLSLVHQGDLKKKPPQQHSSRKKFRLFTVPAGQVSDLQPAEFGVLLFFDAHCGFLHVHGW